MATNPYPKISAKAWATLRTRATASPTTKFTPDAVAALLDMSSSSSARHNTVRPMQQLGLIDEDGVLTDRGNKWRIDTSFGDACQEILDEIYPDEFGILVDDDGHPDQKTVKTWFQKKGFGESNARLMAATYVLIASKHLPEPPGTKPTKAKKKESSGTKPKQKSREPLDTEESPTGEISESPSPSAMSTGGPTVHIDIQIHIPADATLEQIDQIFASMARHLYTT